MNKIKMFSGLDYYSDYMAYTQLENKINKFGENNKIINVSICCPYYRDDKNTKFVYTAAVIYKDESENMHIVD